MCIYVVAAGATRNQELVAGMFEMTMGALHRGGRMLLVKHILSWCCSCVLLMTAEQSAGGNPENILGSIDLHAASGARALGELQLQFQPMFPLLGQHDVLDAIGAWSEGSLREAGGCSILAHAGCIVQPAQEVHRTRLCMSEQVPPRYMLDLHCYESNCGARASTQWCLDSTQVYQEANALGWGKPPSRPWTHARCQAHRWW